MSDNINDDHDDLQDGPQGHAIGFVDSTSQCVNVVTALNAAGVSESSITVLKGEQGANRLKEMMKGSLWGESAEELQRQGLNELDHGHCVLVIEAEDLEKANLAAQIAVQARGYSFYHFRLMEDVRLTK